MASIFPSNNTEPLFISVIEKKQKVDKSKAHASISQLPSTPLGSPENRMAKMKKSLSGFMLNSSANGIPNIIRAKSLFFKLIWTICFVISACTGAYYTVDSIFDYLKYNTVTTFDIIAENQSQIVEVIVTSVGCLVQDMTLFIILPSSNECKAYLTLAPFTVVSAYL